MAGKALAVKSPNNASRSPKQGQDYGKNIEKENRKHALKAKWQKRLLGSREKNGILTNIVIYTLLIAIGFIFVYPVLYMFVTSLMNRDDLLDSTIKWIPTTIYTKNYSDALAVLDYFATLGKNIYIAIVPTICQLIVCSATGYGFARYNFPLKKLWMAILILTFVMPSQLTMVPNFYLMTQLKFIGTMKAFVVPAILGQGFKSAIFVLIFYNFHKQVPKSLIEASEIDGAGHLYSYFRIAVPLAIPAVVTVFLFSFVWYWNETYLVNLYLGYKNSRDEGGLTTLLLELSRFQSSYEQIYSAWEASPNRLNEAIRMAGTMLAVAPLLIMYFILQKQFVQSVDNSGITGE